MNLYQIHAYYFIEAESEEDARVLFEHFIYEPDDVMIELRQEEV